MRKELIISALIATIAPSITHAQEAAELSDKITNTLELLNNNSEFDLERLISKTYEEKVNNDEYKFMEHRGQFRDSTPGDYGFIVTDRQNGTVKDIFSSSVPILIDQASGEISVAGYQDSPNTAVKTVSGDEWINVQNEFTEKYLSQTELTRSGRAVSDVARLAGAATMTWAARLCPAYVYPSKVTLHLSAGFDFVIVNSDTGTSIEIIMSDACAGFAKLLEDEVAKSHQLSITSE